MNLNEMALKVHPKILKQDGLFKENSAHWVNYLNTLSEEEKTQLEQRTLIERFEAGKAVKPSKIMGKKINTPTHLTTLDLLKKKLSLSAITTERELSTGTILSHLEKLKGLRLIANSDIEYLKVDLSQMEFDQIYLEVAKSEDGRLKPLVDAFEGKYTYNIIKLVRLFHQ